MSNPNDIKKVHDAYRKAADEVHEMSKDYHKLGYKDLAQALADIAMEIHTLARAKHIEMTLDYQSIKNYSNKDKK